MLVFVVMVPLIAEIQGNFNDILNPFFIYYNIINYKMALKTNIFIVYHKNVNPEKIFTNDYTEEYIKDNFTFYGVNELHEKNIENNKKYNQKFEYNLPIYNPFLQKRGYMETSAYLHVYWNKLYENLNYVGFCQYDMIHNKKILELSKDKIIIEWTKENIVSGNVWNNMMFPSIRNLQFLLDSYNKHFNTDYKIHDLNNLPLSLWQTNIYPIKIYVKLCEWLEKLCNEIYPWSIQSPWEEHWGVMGGFTERAIAIFNAFEIKNGIIWETWGLIHCNGLGEEKFQYNNNHWINQFDLNIHTKFEKIVSKETIDLSNYKLVKDNSEHSDNIYFIKENINQITHIYQIDNKKNTKSKSIMLYLPANCNLFKKRYLALQDNLENCNIYYDESCILLEKDNKIIRLRL